MQEFALIGRLAFSSLLLFLLSIRANADDRPFTRQANVVIMAGLPGDVESEASFLKKEARQLLEILARKESLPKSVHVLIDDPASITLPAGLAGDVKPATRENFLALAKTPAGDATPLVVFAWGHAGLQKATPVFHVRGQRITPDDFAAVAAAAKGPSRWVLLFRGSGSFAKAVHSPQTEIISSEFETAFTSDPIGVDLLTGILRDHAGADFGAIAGLLGDKTVAWYDDKNLARQEEPTLWMGNDAPRMLAKAAGASPSLSGTTPEMVSGSSSSSSKPAPDAEPSAAWSGITPVDATKFPDDAVVLRRTIQYVLGDNPAISLEREEFIQVLTANGKQYGDFDIAYSPPDETITFLDCEVKQPDGTIDRLDADAIRDAQKSGTGEYGAERRKIFSLPHVVPGAILHVRYRTEWKRSALPHSFLQIPLAESIPIGEQRIQR